jgi:hypothetical protein
VTYKFTHYILWRYILCRYIILVILALVIIYLILSVYLRIKMPFWRTQPVFHIYNLNYWLRPPGTINREPPSVNKFVNLSNNTLLLVDASNTTVSVSNTTVSVSNTTVSVSNICKFIRDYYIIHDAASYKPSEQDILAYLQCCNQPSFFNVYQETPIPFGSSEREIVGAISARVLNVTLVKKKQPLTFPVYYIDNLCVNPGYRKKGIAPELIQTFYYTISRANPKVNGYLFKREGQLNAIVPLVCYDTYAFDMMNFCATELLTAAMTVIELGVHHLSLFIGFIKAQGSKFECIVLPDVSNVLNLIKLGKIKIYGILYQSELISVYIFRCLELYYEGKKAVECITILSTNVKQTDILITGFTMSWLKLKIATMCDIVFIEETAHSKPVIQALDKNPLVVRNFKSPTAFFLYNYAAYSVPSAKTLLIY